MSKDFSLTFPSRWTRCPIDNIKWFFRWLKWSYQRAFNGYSQCDTWGIDYYLVRILIPMITRLRNRDIGYPESCSSPEVWNSILDQIIEGFKAAERLLNLEYESDFHYHMRKDEVIFKNGMRLFTEYFFNLWD